MDLDIIEYLERELEEDLPGESSHIKMAPLPNYRPTIKDDHKIGCVLILLYPKNKEWHLLLVKRAHNDSDNHSSQISFPGGKLEDSDYSYSDCALRETHEEVGIDPSSIGIVGELSSIYVQASNFMVFPFVGFTSSEPNFEPDSDEVEFIVEVPLEQLFETKLVKRKPITLYNGITIESVPYFNFCNEVVWGATAMILSELKDILEKSDLF
jgi:8-oxo-dGTP pyrophosphatase MutT (NUDIX family)